MWQFGHSTQWRIRGTRDSPMATCSVKTTAVTDGFRLIPFRFYLGILSGIGYSSDSLGDRIHSLFTPIPSPRTTSGLAPSRSLGTGMQDAEVPKISSIARIGRV
jgi:hypothetical protein